MRIFLIIAILLLISYLYLRFSISYQTRNQKIINFKNKFLSKEINIEKIYLRDNERTSQNPNINIIIDSMDSEETITSKVNIHRARLAKFKKSKLNGELIYMDNNKRVYKFISGEKIFFE